MSCKCTILMVFTYSIGIWQCRSSKLTLSHHYPCGNHSNTWMQWHCAFPSFWFNKEHKQIAKYTASHILNVVIMCTCMYNYLTTYSRTTLPLTLHLFNHIPHSFQYWHLTNNSYKINAFVGAEKLCSGTWFVQWAMGHTNIVSIYRHKREPG